MADKTKTTPYQHIPTVLQTCYYFIQEGILYSCLVTNGVGSFSKI